jgi:hypothetical protein
LLSLFVHRRYGDHRAAKGRVVHGESEFPLSLTPVTAVFISIIGVMPIIELATAGFVHGESKFPTIADAGNCYLYSDHRRNGDPKHDLSSRLPSNRRAAPGCGNFSLQVEARAEPSMSIFLDRDSSNSVPRQEAKALFGELTHVQQLPS